MWAGRTGLSMTPTLTPTHRHSGTPTHQHTDALTLVSTAQPTPNSGTTYRQCTRAHRILKALTPPTPIEGLVWTAWFFGFAGFLEYECLVSFRAARGLLEGWFGLEALAQDNRFYQVGWGGVRCDGVGWEQSPNRYYLYLWNTLTTSHILLQIFRTKLLYFIFIF